MAAYYAHVENARTLILPPSDSLHPCDSQQLLVSYKSHTKEQNTKSFIWICLQYKLSNPKHPSQRNVSSNLTHIATVKRGHSNFSLKKDHQDQVEADEQAQVIGLIVFLTALLLKQLPLFAY